MKTTATSLLKECSGKPVVVPSDGGGAMEFIEHGHEGIDTLNLSRRQSADAFDSLYCADRSQAKSDGTERAGKTKGYESLVAARGRDVGKCGELMSDML